VAFEVVAPRAGLYDVRIRFAAPEGPEACALDVNGVKFAGHVPRTPEGQWVEHDAGTIEQLRGLDALTQEKSWEPLRCGRNLPDTHRHARPPAVT
jgi:hypothetical protein